MGVNMQKIAFIAIALSAVGCGHSGLGQKDDLGNGTGTLRVDGNVEANNLVDNANDPGNFSVNASVVVRQSDGTPIGNAIVVLTSDEGATTLTLNTNGGIPTYEGTQNTYRQVYQLKVDVDANNYIHGVQIDGPDFHVFTAPLTGVSVSYTQDLNVTWNRHDQAQSAWIEGERMDRLDITDTGTFTMPHTLMNQRPGVAEPDRLRLWRSNRLTPAGAVGDSGFTVTVRNEVQFLVVP
jgi:hypothetical protein